MLDPDLVVQSSHLPSVLYVRRVYRQISSSHHRAPGLWMVTNSEDFTVPVCLMLVDPSLKRGGTRKIPHSEVTESADAITGDNLNPNPAP